MRHRREAYVGLGVAMIAVALGTLPIARPWLAGVLGAVGLYLFLGSLIDLPLPFPRGGKVRLRVVPAGLVPHGADPRVWRLGLWVVNDGPTGTFSARVHDPADGSSVLGAIVGSRVVPAWQMTVGEHCTLAKGDRHQIFFGIFDEGRRHFRFLQPPDQSPYNYHAGSAFVPQDDLEFVLAVRDVDRDREHREKVRVVFDPETNHPTVRTQSSSSTI